MKQLLATALGVVVAMGTVSCQKDQLQPSVSIPQAAVLAEGKVRQISATHGNVYTDIRPDRYESLGLTKGKLVQVEFEGKKLPMVIGSGYADVPTGAPVAVLHREGLTFAIRDGNFSKMHGIEVGDRFRVWQASEGKR